MKIEFIIKIPTTIEEVDLSIKQLNDDVIVLSAGDVNAEAIKKFGVDKKVLQAALEKSQELYTLYVKPTEDTKKPEPTTDAALAPGFNFHNFEDN